MAQRLGKLPPQHKFLLNPYTDIRCSTCPGCQRKTKQRKLPLFIAIKEGPLMSLNKTCRYCPSCDILIAHKDELEGLLAHLPRFQGRKVQSEDYLVVGTVERSAWRRGVKEHLGTDELLANLHDFKEYLKLEVTGGWGPADPDKRSKK